MVDSPRKVSIATILSSVEEMLQAVQQNTIKAKLREASIAAAKAHQELSQLSISNTSTAQL